MKNLRSNLIAGLFVICFTFIGTCQIAEAKASNDTIYMLMDRFENNPQIQLLLLNLLNKNNQIIEEDYINTNKSEYILGEKIYVSWDFNHDLIKCASLESDGTGSGFTFFCDKVYSDEPTASANNIAVQTSMGLTYPGSYRITLTTTDNNKIYSDIFEIKPIKSMEEIVPQTPLVVTLNFNKDQQVVRRGTERVSFKVKEYRFDTEKAYPSEGFSLNAQVRIPDNTIEGKFVSSHVGYYNYETDEWFVEVEYPRTKGNYVLRVAFWCSNTLEVCEERYPTWSGETKRIPFIVN